jgi:hypothetical protein
MSSFLQRIARFQPAFGFLRHHHPYDAASMVRRLHPNTPMHTTLLIQLEWNFIPSTLQLPIPPPSIVNEIMKLPVYPSIGFDPSMLQLMPSREYNPHWRKRKSKHGYLR